MCDFRMKLDAVYSALAIFDRIERIVRESGYMKPTRHRRYLIAMAHPDIHLRRQLFEQWTRFIHDLQSRIAKLAIAR